MATNERILVMESGAVRRLAVSCIVGLDVAHHHARCGMEESSNVLVIQSVNA